MHRIANPAYILGYVSWGRSPLSPFVLGWTMHHFRPIVFPKDINTVYSLFADENIIKKAEEFKRDGYKNFERVKITDVTERIKADVENLVGFDASGYEIYSTTDTFKHIEKRHGENGQHDQSMKDMRDVALMGYVLNNYDKAELIYNENGQPETTSAYSDKNGKHSKLIKFSKEIDGIQYVVVATPENKYKKLWVLSEYKTQKKILLSRVMTMLSLETVSKFV